MQKIKDYIYYNRKEIITIIICLISFFSFNVFNSKDDTVVLNENLIKNEESKKIEEQIIIVDVKGEVLSPGTYQLESGKRIIDAVIKSGGLTSNADVNTINLSEKLVDEMVIYIPSKNSDNIQTSNNSIKKESNKEIKDNKISINNASVSTLMTLSGIGQKKAEAIISYREQNGPFKSIEEITKVSGIGNSLFDKIKDFIKI